MTYTFKLSRRLAITHFHAMMLGFLLVLCACTGNDINAPSAIDLARGGIRGRPQKPGSDTTLIQLSIAPTVDTLSPTEHRAFLARGLRKNGDTVAVAATWMATGGQISSAGEYTAGSVPGRFQVIGTYLDSTLADTSEVIISSNDGATLSAIVLTPQQVSLSARSSQQFTAAGLLSDGSPTLANVTYSATGGTITSTGLFTAGQTGGTFQVIASESSGGLADTALVEVVPEPAPSLVQVVLRPGSTSLVAGQTKQFSAYGVMSNGDSVAVSASYSATGGTISPSGLYTAGSVAGTFRAIAIAAGKADTSTITVSPPPTTSSPSSIAEGCPTSGYLRLVNVSTASELASALSAAIPGDQIRLAPGTYAGGFFTSRDGTQSSPITLCGPRSATIQNTGGWFALKADWWVFRGFRVISGVVGLWTDNANHLIIDSLLVENVNQEGIMLQGTSGSSYNIVRNNTIRYTGRVQSVYGEGIYVGSGQTNNHPSNYNQIVDNHFGPGVTAEHVELKVGTSGNLVKGNVSDATGTQFLSGAVGGVYTIAGADQKVEDNSVFNLDEAGMSAFWAFRVNGAVFHRNSAAGPLMSWGFRVSDATNVVVYCDNTGTKNVACSP